jgi:hypothetical protein
MQTLSWLVDFVGPNASSAEQTEQASKSRRLLAACIATLLALGAAALWGVVVGARGHLSLSNIVTVPMLISASALAALPLALFTLKLISHRLHATDLLLSYTSAAFAGCTTLLLLAPLVAIYQQSSWLVGNAIGPISAVIAFVVSGAVFVRSLLKVNGTKALGVLSIPVLLLVVVQGACLVQLASLSNPLFGARTRLGHGIDAIEATESQSP